MATFTGSDKAIGFLFDMVANIADDYDATSTYAVNDYAIYNGVLYKCISAISIAEDFTPAHWTAVLVMDEIGTGGGGGSTTLAGLSDVAISSVANNDVLTYDGTLGKWKNAAGGFVEVTGTLSVGSTTITLSDASIQTTSTIDVYTDIFGVNPTSISVSTGSITLTFAAQSVAIGVKVRVS